MKLNRKVEFALIALRHMATKKEEVLTSAKEIADLYGCSFDVTSRVLQRLAQKSILRSSQGANGGYQIVKDLKEVSFNDLNSILVGPLGVARCLHESGSPCEIKASCNIMTPMQRLNQKLQNFYQTLSVAELLADGEAMWKEKESQTLSQTTTNNNPVMNS